MVEQVAYELLLAHNNEDLEDNDSLAEFVDQCKVREIAHGSMTSGRKRRMEILYNTGRVVLLLVLRYTSRTVVYVRFPLSRSWQSSKIIYPLL